MAGEPREAVRRWWVLAGLVPLGFGAAGAFAYAAQRTRVRRWWAYATVYGALATAGMILAQYPDDSLEDEIAGGWASDAPIFAARR